MSEFRPLFGIRNSELTPSSRNSERKKVSESGKSKSEFRDTLHPSPPPTFQLLPHLSQAGSLVSACPPLGTLDARRGLINLWSGRRNAYGALTIAGRTAKFT